MNPFRILLADDHQIILDGLEKIIQDMPDFVLLSTASNGREVLEKAPILLPDVIIMDLDMPVLNGMEASRELLKSMPDVKIIILTMHGEPSLVSSLMKSGISGYVLKNADQNEFMFAVRQVMKGKKYFQAEAMEGLVKGTHLTPGTTEVEILALLSEREKEVLKLIAAGKTSVDIGSELHIATRTVETHRKNIHEKLDIRNIAGLVRFAIKSGLVS